MYDIEQFCGRGTPVVHSTVPFIIPLHRIHIPDNDTEPVKERLAHIRYQSGQGMPGTMVEEADTSDSGAGAKKPPIYGVEVDQGKLLYSAAYRADHCLMPVLLFKLYAM